MATRGQNTMVEGLQSLLGDLASMKALPDADLTFLLELETMVLKKLREPVDAMAGQLGGGPGAGMPGPGMAPPPPPGPPGMPSMPPMPPGQPGGAPGGMMVGAGAPNPDELRRVIGRAQG